MSKASLKEFLGSEVVVNLVGTAGSGKSHFGREIVIEWASDFSDGVYLVDFGLVANPSLVGQAVADVLGVYEEPSRPVSVTLSYYLVDKKLLLILDSCDHVQEACLGLIKTLRQYCPELRFVVISRERLAEQRIFRLDESGGNPLVGKLSGDRLVKKSLASVIEQSYGRLPIEAQSLLQELVVLGGEYELELVSALCPNVEQVGLLVEGGLLEVLPNGRYGLNLAVRQFARQELLASGRADGLYKKHIDYFVSQVRQRERQREREQETKFEQSNLRLALERALRYNQQEWFEAGIGLVKGLWGIWLERGNLKEARGWYEAALAIRSDDGELLYKAGTIAVLQGDYEQGTIWCEHALAVNKAVGDKVGLGWSLYGLGVIAQAKNRLEAAIDFYEQSAVLFEGLEDKPGMAWSFYGLGCINLQQTRHESAYDMLKRSAGLYEGNDWGRSRIGLTFAIVAHHVGKYEEAIEKFKQSYGFLIELKHSQGAAHALFYLASTILAQGDAGRAEGLYERCLTAFRAYKESSGVVGALLGLGEVAREQADYGRAKILYEEALALTRKFKLNEEMGWALLGLADVLREQANYVGAASLLEQSLNLLRQAKNTWGIASAASLLGLVKLRQQKVVSAVTLCQESLRLFREVGSKRGIASSLEDLAAILSYRKKAEVAARVFGAAEALRELIDIPIRNHFLAEYEKDVAGVRGQLEPMVFEDAWLSGRAMPFEEAIEYALGAIQGV